MLRTTMFCRFATSNTNRIRAYANPLVKRSFSSIVATTSWKWKWFYRVVRAARVAGLAVVIYQAGYTTGLTDFAHDPIGMEKEMVSTIIASSGASEEPLGTHDIKYKKIERVAVRIVKAGQDLCEKKLHETNALVEAKKQKIVQMKRQMLLDKKKYVPSLGNNKNLATDSSKEKKNSIDEMRENIQKTTIEITELQTVIDKWSIASKKLRGEWKFIVLRNPVPNAFVTDLCPRRIFVNVGLLDVVKPTDDELGLILGHELSHLILKHSHDHNQLSAFLASFQLILLVFVDPTGMLSLITDFCASSVMKYIDNAYSRHDEEEADDLGIQIAAMSCFDTKKAANVFAKFAALERIQNQDTPTRWTTAWSHTHPSSQDRYLKMLHESETYNPRTHGCGWGYYTAFNLAKSKKQLQ